jgi:putative DNA primase/helicase
VQPKTAFIGADTVKPASPSWLWPAWIPLGELTILGGLPGCAKSTLSTEAAAIVSSHRCWPGGSSNAPPRSVVIYALEDDPSKVIIPRLEAAQAGRARIRLIPTQAVVTVDLLLADFNSQDIPSLVILDPLLAVIGDNSNGSQGVRKRLLPFIMLAREFQFALLGIHHLAKGSSNRIAQERLLGSGAFGALARSILMAVKKDGTNECVLTRVKSNYADTKGGWPYNVVPCTLKDGIQTTSINWGAAEINQEAETILEEATPRKADRVWRTECEESLARFLWDEEVDGPVPRDSRGVLSFMKEAGYSQKQVRSAREKLGVQTRRQGFGGEMRSIWQLPPDFLHRYKPESPSADPVVLTDALITDGALMGTTENE